MIRMLKPTTRPSLGDLSKKHGSDKEGVHAYTRHYESLLTALRDEPIKLLEIGIGGYDDPRSGGQSLRMWKEYFPRAQIWGLDITDKTALMEDRIHIHVGSQSDPKVIDGLFSAAGNFDVVVDDGSHKSSDIITTFNLVFPRLENGALYFVEDVQTSYWNFAGGSLNHRARNTTMGFFKERADGLNHADFDRPWFSPSPFDVSIEALHFFNNLIAIEKGENNAPSSMLPKHPHSLLSFLRRRPTLRMLAGPLIPLLRRTMGTERRPGE
jgi:hypothetical protein